MLEFDFVLVLQLPEPGLAGFYFLLEVFLLLNDFLLLLQLFLQLFDFLNQLLERLCQVLLFPLDLLEQLAVGVFLLLVFVDFVFELLDEIEIGGGDV